MFTSSLSAASLVPPTLDPDETLRQVRVAIRTAMNGRTLRMASEMAGVSENTITRIMRGENVTVLTAARICANLGARLVVRVETNRNM